MKTNNGTLSRTLTAAQLRSVYAILEDEATPYEARVTTFKDGKCLLYLSIRLEDKTYFQKLIKRACDEAKI